MVAHRLGMRFYLDYNFCQKGSLSVQFGQCLPQLGACPCVGYVSVLVRQMQLVSFKYHIKKDTKKSNT